MWYRGLHNVATNKIKGLFHNVFLFLLIVFFLPDDFLLFIITLLYLRLWFFFYYKGRFPSCLWCIHILCHSIQNNKAILRRANHIYSFFLFNKEVIWEIFVVGQFNGFCTENDSKFDIITVSKTYTKSELFQEIIGKLQI
jgi:hypothetical protein